LLCIGLRENSHDMGWLYPEFLAKLTKKDDRWEPGVSVELVQPKPLRSYGRPPFDLDPRTCRAVRAALNHVGLGRVSSFGPENVASSFALLAAIRRHLEG
jgi:hypothetical protein